MSSSLEGSMTLGWALARCLALEELEKRGMTPEQAEARLEEVGLYGDFVKWKASISDEVRLIEERRLPGADVVLAGSEDVTTITEPRGDDG